jgi:hypothetical protein
MPYSPKKKKSYQASDMHVLHVCLKILVIKYLQVLRNFLFFPLIFSVYVTVNVMVGGITCINYYDSSSSCQLRIVEKKWFVHVPLHNSATTPR